MKVFGVVTHVSVPRGGNFSAWRLPWSFSSVCNVRGDIGGVQCFRWVCVFVR